MDVKEQIALAILKGAGGDVDKDYTSTNAIYKDVESIYRAQDNRQDVEPLQVELIDNGIYTYDDRNTQGYKPVEINVNVPVDDYYNSGFENGIEIQKAKLESITITENGIYNKEDGYDEVEVNIDTQSYYDNGYNNGTQDQKSKLESITITENGIYNKEDGYDEVEVNIDTQSYYDNGYNNGTQDQKSKLEAITITENGIYNKEDGYDEVEVNIDTQSYYDDGYEKGYDEGVDNGIQEQKSKLEAITITENGIYNKEDGYDEVEVTLDTQSYYDNGYESGYGEGVDNGIQEQKAKLESITIESNGTYIKEDGYNKVKVALDIPKPKIYNGFRFNNGNGVYNDYKYFKDIDFGLFDWSMVYDTSGFFNGYISYDGGGLVASDFDNFIQNYNGDMLSCSELFKSTHILELPNFGEMTKNCVNMANLVQSCGKLEDASNIQYWNTSNVTNMSYMFYECRNLIYVSPFNTSKVTNMINMFYGCQSLESIPQLDTSMVTSMGSMFYGCQSLESIPQLDTSKITSMGSMFYGCQSLESIPQLDTSKVTSMGSMFYGCQSLESIPLLDTSKVTDMRNMFSNCYELTSIPLLDTSKVTNMSSMFNSCTKLKSIPLLDTSMVTNVSGFLGYSNIDTLTDLGGFKDLGKKSSISGINSDFLNRAPNLTHESLMNVINNLYDRKSNGLSSTSIKFGTDNLNKLTDEEKAIATNKGWNLT